MLCSKLVALPPNKNRSMQCKKKLDLDLSYIRSDLTESRSQLLGREMRTQVTCQSQGWHVETNHHSHSHLRAILDSTLTLTCMSLDRPAAGQGVQIQNHLAVTPTAKCIWITWNQLCENNIIAWSISSYIMVSMQKPERLSIGLWRLFKNRPVDIFCNCSCILTSLIWFISNDHITNRPKRAASYNVYRDKQPRQD